MVPQACCYQGLEGGETKYKMEMESMQSYHTERLGIQIEKVI